MTNKFCKY